MKRHDAAALRIRGRGESGEANCRRHGKSGSRATGLQNGSRGSAVIVPQALKSKGAQSH
jgi:hypothetical protein